MQSFGCVLRFFFYIGKYVLWNKKPFGQDAQLRAEEKLCGLSFRCNMIINQFFHKDKSLLSPRVYEKMKEKKGSVSVRSTAGLRKGGTTKV